jgi:membrane-bound lytic murein transglycosylase D
MDIKGKTKLIYTVKDADNIGFISEWYKVGLSDLRNWNNLYRNNIRVGQKLVVYVEPSKAEQFSKINTMELADKQALVGKATVATAPQPLATTNGPGEIDGDYIIYTVRKGDSIWDIVKMFDNVTTTQVLSLNNITDPAKIKVGQRLKIKKKS